MLIIERAVKLFPLYGVNVIQKLLKSYEKECRYNGYKFIMQIDTVCNGMGKSVVRTL